jgi:lipopolysaccharide transport system ATP-binding protein
MKPILEVQHISKEFFIGGEPERYLSLRDIVSNPFKKLKQPKVESFWALEDVSFDIMPGESVGIIGRNGAGKSTLLKILSKITPPTKGKIICRGRIASLLEVGTGFHPELTGRENIYMNGSILGMRKKEIDKHFDAIVDFSGVEQFLDTPLKRYSSGMQLRLAFAVAAHLEPEILVIDEVLAVGDTEFQKKCLGKMEDVSKSEGKTILFVSHNLSAIAGLCTKGIVLNRGRVNFIGEVNKALTYYSGSLSNVGLRNQVSQEAQLIFQDIIVRSEAIANSDVFFIGDNVNIKVVIKVFRNIATLIVNLNVINSNGELMAHLVNEDDNLILKNLSTGTYEIDVQINEIMVTPGLYTIDLWAGSSYAGDSMYQMSKSATSFEVIQGKRMNRSSAYPSNAAIFMKSKWSINEAVNIS